MDIEKLMNEPDQFFSGVTARITEQAIEFENRCIGEALSMWQIRKEDVLKRIHEADKIQAENEKLRAELERVKRERGAAIADWQGFCAKCVWNGKQYLSDGKMDDRCKTCRDNNKCNWEWRGIKED